MKRVLFSFLFSLLVVGCLNQPAAIEDPVLPRSDVSEISISADFIDEGADNTKTVVISSNRNWSARLVDLDNGATGESITWASLVDPGHVNLSRSVEDTEMNIVFQKNESRIPHNGMLEFFSEGQKCLNIPVNQAGIVFHLRVSSLVESVAAQGETLTLDVDCNTNWSVSVSESSTAEVRLPSTSGYSSEELSIRVLENEDAVEKSVSLTFSAEDCEDVVVNLRQLPADGSVKFWEVFTRFEGVASGSAPYPLLIIDKERTSAEALLSGAKFYFTVSDTSFEDAGLPTTSSTQLPDAGWEFLSSTRVAYTVLYVNVLGTCEGYRDTYTRVLIRNWEFGTRYTGESVNGLTLTGTNTIGTTYMYFDGDRSASAEAIYGGTGCTFFDIYCGNYAPTIYLNIKGNTFYSWPVQAQQYPSTNHGAFTCPLYDLEAGDTIELTTFVKRSVAYQWALLEQSRFRI